MSTVEPLMCRHPISRSGGDEMIRPGKAHTCLAVSGGDPPPGRTIPQSLISIDGRMASSPSIVQQTTFVPGVVRAALRQAQISEIDFLLDVAVGMKTRGRYSTAARTNPHMGAAAAALPVMSVRLLSDGVDADVWLTDQVFAECRSGETKITIPEHKIPIAYRWMMVGLPVNRVIDMALLSEISAPITALAERDGSATFLFRET